jgi:MFS family permease
VGCLGFALCYGALLAMRVNPDPALLWFMVLSQGVLGYGVTSVFGAIPAEIFQGRHYGTIFGTLSVAAMTGGALGPWVTGALYDATGDYTIAFCIAIGCSLLSGLSIWLAAPRQIRAVAGRVPKSVGGAIR